MKTPLLCTFLMLWMGWVVCAQGIGFESYDLDNGLHVLLHQDTTVPVVVTGIMYHVGAKDEAPEKTGFAHFFEHLLFEGTKHIPRGEWDRIVASHGGTGNANTFLDRTYYYETFPSNNLDVGLWLESERLLHPVIEQVGVETQKQVVQEERQLRVDNAPYGAFFEQLLKHLYPQHPYRRGVLGSMEHLAGATVADFQQFKERYYVPNNAVLVVAGDIAIASTKAKIEAYFGPIPRGATVIRKKVVEAPITETIQASYQDPNIQIPALFLAYRTPGRAEREAYVMDMISAYLSDGESAKLYKKLVEEEKIALQIVSSPVSAEDYSAYVVGGIPADGQGIAEIKQGIDAEIVRLQTELISENDYQKLQNKFEMAHIDRYSSLEGIAHSLAEQYLLCGDANRINTAIEMYRSITREEIRAVAKKYLMNNQRVELAYVPEN